METGSSNLFAGLSWGDVAMESENLFGPAGACEPYRACTPPEAGEIVEEPSSGAAALAYFDAVRAAPDPYLPPRASTPPGSPPRETYGQRLLRASAATESRHAQEQPRMTYGQQLERGTPQRTPATYGQQLEQPQRVPVTYAQRVEQLYGSNGRGYVPAAGYGVAEYPVSRSSMAMRGSGQDRSENRQSVKRSGFNRAGRTVGGTSSGHRPDRGSSAGVAGVFIRQRAWKEHTWYEFLLEHRHGSYQFPQAGDIAAVATLCAKRGMLYPPHRPEELEACLQTVVTAHSTCHRVYLVPWESTQRPHAGRRLRHPPAYFWCAESEVAAAHVAMGPASAFGCPVSTKSLAALRQLPLHLQFASMTPPLVLYHGTDAAAAALIGAVGMLPSAKAGMLGPGMYFAKWDKAAQFAREDADRVVRTTPGCVLRAIVAPAPTRTMTAADVCTCGCARAFVDHNGRHAAGTDITHVPDNSLPATRRAEWCVRNPDVVLVDGVFDV
jgi:hypothetical protein